MAVVHHFAFGWINPIIAYVMSFLGSLLGLVLTARARQVPAGPARVPWLLLAAVSIGGTGIWLMHFMAALRVRLDASVTHISGVSPFVLLMPISILACLVISALAYAALGLSMYQENEREEVLLAEARDQHQTAAMVGPGLTEARHR